MFQRNIKRKKCGIIYSGETLTANWTQYQKKLIKPKVSRNTLIKAERDKKNGKKKPKKPRTENQGL